jgi:uncharacterized cupin superfamily protein
LSVLSGVRWEDGLNSGMSRPSFIRNIADLFEEPHYPGESEDQFRTTKRLSRATGLARLGVNWSRLRPGQASSRFHFHTVEEEFFYILSGRAVLWYGDAYYDLGPGDALSLLPNGPAHQITNPYTEDCVYLNFCLPDLADLGVCPDDGTKLRCDGLTDAASEARAENHAAHGDEASESSAELEVEPESEEGAPSRVPLTEPIPDEERPRMAQDVEYLPPKGARNHAPLQVMNNSKPWWKSISRWLWKFSPMPPRAPHNDRSNRNHA